jgi:hypothetical protein
MGQWNVMSKDMPILVADWQKKFDELLASKKLPRPPHRSGLRK